MSFQVASTASASVNASSTRTALTGAGAPHMFLRLATGSTTTVFVKFGDSSVTATTSDFAVPNGVSVVLTVPAGSTHIAHIGSAAGPSTIYMSQGWERT